MWSASGGVGSGAEVEDAAQRRVGGRPAASSPRDRRAQL
jgi:hypothetical protein